MTPRSVAFLGIGFGVLSAALVGLAPDVAVVVPTPTPYYSTGVGWNRDSARIAAAQAKEAQKKRLEEEAVIMACVQFVLEQSSW